MATWIRSLEPPPPLTSGEEPDGEAIFERAGCADCHRPPLYTSDRRISVASIGTDPLAGTSEARFTGYYRIPSLRGVGRTAPYLHHGAFASLEAMFDPERQEPGHAYGLALDEPDRDALLRFLRTL